MFSDKEKCSQVSGIENRVESLPRNLYKNDSPRSCSAVTLHHRFGSMEIVYFLQHDKLCENEKNKLKLKLMFEA